MHCEKFTETIRANIFETFWAMTWQEKKMFVSSMVDMKPTQNPKKETPSRRNCTRVYYLKLGDQKFRVCLRTFIGILGIKEWTIRYWLGERPKDQTQIISERNTISTLKASITEFLHLLPKLPSHYCRKNSTKLVSSQLFHQNVSYTEYTVRMQDQS